MFFQNCFGGEGWKLCSPLKRSFNGKSSSEVRIFYFFQAHRLKSLVNFDFQFHIKFGQQMQIPIPNLGKSQKLFSIYGNIRCAQ